MTTDQIGRFNSIYDQGLMLMGRVDVYTDVNTFQSFRLALKGNNRYEGWYVYAAWDNAGASAAPQGEYRLITDYVSVDGVFTHNAFSAALAVDDIVMIIHPMLYEILTIRGGAYTIQDLWDEMQTQIDVARSTDSTDTTMDGSEQVLYEDEGDPHPMLFAGGVIDLTNMAGGDTIRIRIYHDYDDGGWVRESDDAAWTFTGAQDPALVRIPGGYYSTYGVRVTAEQTAGTNRVVGHEWFDGKRGS